MNQDNISFHDLYARYANDIYRFSFWLTGDADEARDITSETFVRVWTSEADIRVESVKAYLFTIARNVYLHDKRRTKHKAALDETVLDSSMQPDRIAEARSELHVVLQAMQMLPEIDRTVLIMRAEDELSYEEIASATGLSIAAVKVKVFRARLKLQSLLTSLTGENYGYHT
jgi:RNA polymerase sigma factor (sigma-70 family)